MNHNWRELWCEWHEWTVARIRLAFGKPWGMAHVAICAVDPPHPAYPRPREGA